MHDVATRCGSFGQVRGLALRGPDVSTCSTLFAFGGSEEAKCAVAKGEGDVVAFTHGNQQGTSGVVCGGHSVFAGDGEFVVCEPHPVRGVGGSVDEAHSDLVAGFAAERAGVKQGFAVDEVMGVGDVLACSHVATTWGVAQLLECGVGAQCGVVGGDTVEPVIKHHNPFVVGGTGVVGVVDEQNSSEASIELEAHVRVEKERARVGGSEGVREFLPWCDGWLGEVWDSVHVVAESDAMPMDGGGGGEVVVQRSVDGVAGGGADHWPWHGVVVGPGVDGDAAKVDGGGRSRECGALGGAGGCALCFSGSDLRAVGCNPSVRRAGFGAVWGATSERA